MPRPAPRSASEGESASRAQQTIGAANTSQPVARIVDSSDGAATGDPSDGENSPQNVHAVVPRLDLTVLRTAGEPHADKAQRTAQQLEALGYERREPKDVQVSQHVQQQVVRDALAHAQAVAGARSAASTATAQKQNRAYGQSKPGRRAARAKGRPLSSDKRGQQHDELAVSSAAMRSQQQATVARKISQLWGAGRGVPLQAKVSLQYA
jgi:hypothetical protein